MACGQPAECIYDLIDHLGGETDVVLGELIKFLPGHVLKEFVDDYARHNGIMGYEQHEICMVCQDNYDTNDDHTCELDDDTDTLDEDDTIPPKGDTVFFSSRIPSC